MGRVLYIFDFDGTLTNKDSLVDFIQYAVGKTGYYLGLLRLSPILAAYKLGLIPNYIAKEKLIGHFFKDWESKRFTSVVNRYSLEELDKIIRPRAREFIETKRGEGHEMVVVSASMESWLKKWCAKNRLTLIGTRLEIRDGRLTGKFATKNCYGIEKVNRIHEHYNLKDYDTIHVFGDSRGDREMLQLGDHSYYKYFN